MVQLWISLRNDKITKPCINRKFRNIFKDKDNKFYGDYDLDVYFGTKNEYKTYEEVVEKVVKKESGWIRNIKDENKKQLEVSPNSLKHIVFEFGWLNERAIKKMFPRKETYEVINFYQYRSDGNFKMFAIETSKFFYVFCFATS